ncbi:hypothetical protein O181_120497 [Austropuccinia psidii MF-1]|uniref:Uncharacterized protein n=1 Tax=Austropuccinia psidii MF-1 TaxID=1389203 RepID=A0A9Q3KH54_9BASI|nr:hypothetical protein [Austropuccinia psidii MF-1]
MKSRRSRSFSGLLGGYPGMSEGAREILGEVKDEEGEESVDEEDSGQTEVADALENAPEVPQGSNLAPANQPLVSFFCTDHPGDPLRSSSLNRIVLNLIQVSSRSWRKWLLLWDNFLKQQPPGTIPKPLHSRLHQ